MNRSCHGRLEGQGPYLTKKVDGTDRRYVRVSLTRQTAVEARSARQSRGTWFAERFSHLSTRGRAAPERVRPALEHLIGVER